VRRIGSTSVRRVVAIALAAGAAIVLGLSSAGVAIRSGLSSGQVANGPWRTSLVTGSVDADAHTRARVAVGGLLALAPSETIYFNADVDDAGRPLDRRCDYRVSGTELPARWWSLTAYGADHFLIPNDAGRYSFSQTTLGREPGGRWAIAVSGESQAGNWLPSGRPQDGGPFALTLRLYNPAPEVHERAATVALPRIERLGCR
jgi:hypothetical protein